MSVLLTDLRRKKLQKCDHNGNICEEINELPFANLCNRHQCSDTIFFNIA